MWRTTWESQTFDFAFVISIHVLRVEDDIIHTIPPNVPRDFNPRPPCGGRRLEDFMKIVGVRISIHVLRVEDDSRCFTLINRIPHFNPRPPCGGRQYLCSGKESDAEFQSTSSVWRTTLRLVQSWFAVCYFNPRPPCGGRQVKDAHTISHITISIHVLRVEDDSKNREKSLFAFI